jgi:hypothetical protein
MCDRADTPPRAESPRAGTGRRLTPSLQGLGYGASSRPHRNLGRACLFPACPACQAKPKSKGTAATTIAAQRAKIGR